MVHDARTPSMLRTFAGPARRALRAALLATTVAALAAPHPAFAADPGATYYAGSDGYAAANNGGTLDLGIGKSRIVTLPRDATEVFVADGGVAKAVVRTPRKAYLIGVAPGQTDVKFIDSEGAEIASYDVSVSRDVASIRSSIARSLGDAGGVRVEGVGDGVVVTGSVRSAQEAQTAMDIATGYMVDPKKVVNALKIEGQDQVMLKVKVVEMQREVIKQLGIDYSFDNLSIGKVVLDGVTNFPFSASGETPAGSVVGSYAGSNGSASVRLQAMERAGVIRMLAEPTLTAISGESADFLAGGEFPILGDRECDDGVCTRSYQFKKFGVSLAFVPVVLSGGRISLKISNEVSEIDPNNGVTVDGASIPGLKTRRTNSTIEVPSGGSIVMAGLIQQQTKRAANGLPGLMKLPVLGALFRSNDFQRNETELAVFVTPYLVKPTAPSKLATPIDGFAEPTDQSALLLGRLNRLYGIPGKIDPATVSHRRGGFIID